MNFEEYTRCTQILGWATTLENDEEECYKRLEGIIVLRESGSTEEKRRQNASEAVSSIINLLTRWKEDQVLTITKSNGQSMLIRCEWPATKILEKDYGGSLLHRHVRLSARCSSEVIRTLVRDLHIDVDARDLHGNTALHVLSRHVSKQAEGSLLIKTLVDELGADSLAKDAVGRTPSEIIRRFSPLERRSEEIGSTNAAPELELEPVKLEHSIEEARVCECLEVLDKKRKLILTTISSAVKINSPLLSSPESIWSDESPTSSPVKVLELQTENDNMKPRSLAFSPAQFQEISNNVTLSSFSSPQMLSSVSRTSNLLSSPMPSRLPPLTPSSSNVSFYYAVLRVDSKPHFKYNHHSQELCNTGERIEPSIKLRPLFQGNKGSSVQNANLDSLKKSVEPESGLAVACAVGPFIKKDACETFVKRWKEAALGMVQQRTCFADCDLCTHGLDEKKAAECPLRCGNQCEFSLCIWAKLNTPSLDMLQRVSDIYFKSSKGGRRNLFESESSSSTSLPLPSANSFLGLGSPVRSSCSGMLSAIKDELTVVHRPPISMQRKPTFASFTASMRMSMQEAVENVSAESREQEGTNRNQTKSFSQCISIA